MVKKKLTRLIAYGIAADLVRDGAAAKIAAHPGRACWSRKEVAAIIRAVDTIREDLAAIETSLYDKL